MLDVLTWRCWSLAAEVQSNKHDAGLQSVTNILTNSSFPRSKMFWSLLLTVLCGFAVANINSQLDGHWELWKEIHKKVYSHQVTVTHVYILLLGQ